MKGEQTMVQTYIYAIAVFLVVILVLVALLLFIKAKLVPSGNVTVDVNGKKQIETAIGSTALSISSSTRSFPARLALSISGVTAASLSAMLLDTYFIESKSAKLLLCNSVPLANDASLSIPVIPVILPFSSN